MGIGVLTKYRKHLSVTERTPIINLGEGDTPLVKSRNLGRGLGCDDLYFKLEGCNPTGSFKDRGMVVAVAKAMEAKKTALLCASTGNTSASAAAYGAYGGIPTTVVVPKNKITSAKLAQAIAYGARILVIEGDFDNAMDLVRSISSSKPIALVNSINSHRLEGQKTAAFEIIEQMGEVPDFVFLPVGNAGNITAYWMGFTEAQRMLCATSRPKMMGFQSIGAAPIVRGTIVEKPKTVASAIRVGNPVSWRMAIVARDESGGTIGAVSDKEILNAYHLLAREEGIFCEPAAAASVAGLMKYARDGMSLDGEKVVCVITGTGLKDPDSANMIEPFLLEECPANLEALEQAILSD